MLDLARLTLLGLPLISDLDSLSRLTHLSKGLLYRLVRFPNKQYLTYKLPKKSGGFRLIAQPSREMKALQAWVLRSILDKLVSSSACKGFERGSSTADNARAHIGANAILTFDIEDFYPSVSAGRVFSVFRTLGYDKRVSATLTSVCVFRDQLP